MIPAPHKLSADKVKEFFFAGNATLTLRNVDSGNRFTYRIDTPKKQKNPNKPVFFVNVMDGCDNETGFTFVGTIFGKNVYKHHKGSKIGERDKSVGVIKAFLDFLSKNKMPKSVEVWHEGKCGRCGRKLTVPESIYTGIGPDCIQMVKKEQLQLELIANDPGMLITA